MNEISLITIALILLTLPLIGFTTVINLGSKIKKIYNFEILVSFISLLLAIFMGFIKLTQYVDKTIESNFQWIKFAGFHIDLGIKIDNITVIMLFVVFLISFLVHIFSLEYMKGDIRFNRYFAYLGIFTFSMTGIVITNNFLMMYIFWELVGLSSYLLIGFWFEKKSASDASKKAFLTNRVGDIGFFLGILILFTQYKTLSFDAIYQQISAGVLPFDSAAWLTAAGILLFMGAVGKSAQFPLHVWLPDAMEGPTPVSALIHAATMVAAGVYLCLRLFVILTADAMLVIAVVGAFTSLLAATIALTQTDIKKVLAYSTVSQLGYMVMSVGIGAYSFAFFHLVTHAFFKACLFLGSGSVIYGMHHTQELSDMGGLRKKMPITYLTFLISSIAISGIPLTSGFLSKDGILAGAFAFGDLTGHILIPIFGFVVALLTAFYMFRLVILTFHGKPRNQEKYDHAHESPKVMILPLIILASLSIFIWYTPNPFSPQSGWFLGKWIETPTSVVPNNLRFEFMQQGAEAVKTVAHSGTHSSVIHSEIYEHAIHAAHYPAMILSIVLASLGILFAFLMYQWKVINADKIANAVKPLYNLSKNKWYIDEIYDAIFIRTVLIKSKAIAWFDASIVDGAVNGAGKIVVLKSTIVNWFDSHIVDGTVNFTGFISNLTGNFFRKFQTGKVQNYIVYIIISVLILIVIFNPL